MVADDGSFSITHDLSEYSAGIVYELSASEDGGESANLEGVTIEGDAAQPFSYDLITDPSEPVVGDDVTGTVEVENSNSFGVSKNVEFVFDGETLYDDTVSLDGDASETLIDGETLLENASAGDYEWQVLVDGEERKSGTVNVSEDSGSGSDDGTPGFGVGVALVALLAAAMLALRRQD